MTRRQERDFFLGVLVHELVNDDHSITQVIDLAHWLQRLAATHNRYAEADCNRGLTPDEEKRNDILELMVAHQCKQWGMGVVFSGDPRGATIKLRLPSGKTDDWGKQGLCVPAGA